ncbi:outer membrane protein assembly factor BamB family protein, partial [Shewanella sp.]
MQSWYKNLLAAGLSIALVTACSSSDIEEEPISELVELQASIFPEISWSDSVGGGIDDYYSRLKPSVRYGKIFVADRDGEVVAFDQASGDTVWSKDFADEFGDTLLSKVKGVRLSAGVVAARNKVFVGGESGLLVALNADDGATVWSVVAGGE